ncbi:late control D family protein [Pseudovibrio sp. Tun.PSC04-5.I4]|uniref:phage late control D family protein n=1 Tax=Pseudovibrio sp. Tun.PSC04-5.I4 TaxID=1798213 RepID=UPI00088D0E4F|nr:late control D family protein [Pseudovibrio sp. Tun.PSC04-5.I4]SDR00121.1 hypothetical protein SAMN04515695_2253 [Pseudovibrio sp. Tun.PSC04-5.I4]
MSNWIVDWAVSINGEDISQNLRPYLMSISATDKAGYSSDSCSLVLDDRAGQIKLPSAGSKLVVMLEGKKIFEGITDRPASSGSRSSGQKLTIKAKGFDERSPVKQPLFFHKDDASLGDFLQTAAKKAGFTIKVDPAFKDVIRDYWGASGESFLALGQRYAKELQGAFKIRDKVAVLLPLGAENKLPGIKCTKPGNIISWQIKPRDLKRVFSGGSARYLDRKKGKVAVVKRPYKADEIGDSAAETEDVVFNAIRSTSNDESQVQEVLKAREKQGQREKASGTITIDLAPEAQAEGLCQVEGIKTGIDGTYRIDSRTHKASRGGGATTTLSLKDPQDGAGKREGKKAVTPKPKPKPVGDGLNRNGTTGTQQ